MTCSSLIVMLYRHAQIRQRALVQYTSPFSSVNLSSMAVAFNTSAA